MHRAARIAPPLLALASPALVSAAAPRTFLELAAFFVYIMNNLVSVIIVMSLVVYFWGIVSTIPDSKKAGFEQRKKMLLYGLLGLFVMVSVWGILRILQATLFSSSSSGGGYASGDDTASYCDSFGNCE